LDYITHGVAVGYDGFGLSAPPEYGDYSVNVHLNIYDLLL